ncbi:MAG: MFS transporter, partial [Pseudonocardia sp.]|nr:MFS transporter [Pseudonocardia sp.]
WGILLAPVVAIGLFATLGNALGWRVLFLVGGLPLVVAVVGYFKLPESPRWLAQHGRAGAAEATVTRLEEEAAASGKALAEIEVRTATPVVKTRFRELFSPRYRRRTVLTWTQWFCSYFVTYGYTVWLPTLYVKVAGLSVSRSLALTIITSAIGLASTYTFALTVDRVGRKRYFTTGFFLGLAGAVLAIVLTATSGHGAWVPLFVASIPLQIGIGWSNVGVYLYTPELFPTRMRAWATATGSSMNRIASIIAPIAVGAILGAGLGVTSVFVMFGVAAAVGGLVMAVMGVETKGRTLEELSP